MFGLLKVGYRVAARFVEKKTRVINNDVGHAGGVRNLTTFRRP
jgi:hypothetical protein